MIELGSLYQVVRGEDNIGRYGRVVDNSRSPIQMSNDDVALMDSGGDIFIASKNKLKLVLKVR
ncbi:MAG TPA: hypothetical protein VMT35_00740 [Ignavibacteriaceae bacterium]|nr:hypothetical protein [Ignavibacteriaceae bacterium]